MPDTSANPTGAQMDQRTSTNRSPVVDECRCIYRSHKFANRALGIDYLYVHSYTSLTAGAQTDLGLRDAHIRIVSRQELAESAMHEVFNRVRRWTGVALRTVQWIRTNCMLTVPYCPM
ncbi:hypothetical protein K438DRAFT_1782218 [Mycena galopus ATCC 62051]|nr:hypothetical protein K438DRAFT_1782218 [Mycena galopus ATCC 62051]